MAYASITYTSASGTTFALTNSSGDPIKYLRQADIFVYVNNVLKTLTTDYTFNSAGTAIVLNTAVSGVTVTLQRITAIDDPTVVYTAGSTLTAQDLNNADNQIRFGLQEFTDYVAGGQGVTDGDKGDITVGVNGSVWTVNSADSGNVVFSSNQIKSVSLGSAAAPTYSFTTDTNTGIYSPGADTLAFAEGGVEAMRIDSSGRLGIGTTGPNRKLEVSDAGVDNFIRVNTTGAAKSGIEFASGGTVYSQLYFNNVSPYDLSLLQQYTTGSLILGTNNTERLRIDSSGRVGIGTSSPSIVYRTTINGDGSSIVGGLSLQNNGTETLTIGNVTAANNVDSEIWNPRNGYLRFATNNTEHARIDSSGRLLVGTSTAQTGNNTQHARIQAVGNTAVSPGGGIIALGRNEAAASITSGESLGTLVWGDSGAGEYAWITCEADGPAGSGDYPGRLVFSTTADGASTPTERMRIQADGFLKVSNTGSYVVTNIANGNEAIHQIVSDVSNWALIVSARNAGGTAISASVTSTSATGDLYRGYVEASGGIAYKVLSNGNVQNTNNSYGAISDIKLKENIVDAGSQWSDLKALQVRKYNLKEGQTHTQIGLIAQEVELVSPGLVSESPDRDAEGNDLGTVTKSVNYSVLYMKAVKALQEAMKRIEALEARLTAAGIE